MVDQEYDNLRGPDLLCWGEGFLSVGIVFGEVLACMKKHFDSVPSPT